MKREEMIFACCSDLAGKVRGKSFPAIQLEKRLKRGLGWTPTNVQITCFDVIAESPFGALGDLVLIPDADTLVRLADEGEGPAESFILADIHHMDGRAWEFCTRTILKAALARLKEVAGLTLVSTFEHEFQLRDKPGNPGLAYTLEGFRNERAFAEQLIATLREAGLSPDTFMKEYGIDQYEVTVSPRQGVTSADHAVILRELVRSVGRQLGLSPTFTPIRDPAGIGNGVHIHMSFLDADGNPVAYDEAGTHNLSNVAGSFVAGVLKYLDSIIALTAPSVVSYLRLTPHRWSAAFNNLGFRDREASVRICPVSGFSDVDPASQFNFEFRAADAAASPYLALAAVVHAGVQGIIEGLTAPEATQEDLSLLSPAELESRGFVRLPTSLEEALDRFTANETVTGWFPEGFAALYRDHKLGEIGFLSDRDPASACNAYDQVY
ncbi:MAG: glutamine synthetase family protein [Mesorhizobium sp.]|nr:glutamine synthetase family protein [Mesorhizobium sp.]